MSPNGISSSGSSSDTKVTPPSTQLSIYRGVLLSGLLGDCYGFVFEKLERVIRTDDVITHIDSSLAGESPMLIYSDDTQMSVGTLKSLRANGQLNSNHLAETFTKNYFASGKNRNYREFTMFRDWLNTNYDDPFAHAAKMFGGEGSFGNGAAMRISSAAIYARKMSEQEFTDFIVDVTRLTHTHPLAVLGSLLQAFAVRKVVNLSTSWSLRDREIQLPKFDCIAFIDHLLTILRSVKSNVVDTRSLLWEISLAKFGTRLEIAKELLREKQTPPAEEVVEKLGHSMRAINSVPTALYVFLRSLKPIPEFNYSSVIVRCMAYAFHIGGDTDTIGTMACSLAGGLIGLPAIDQNEEPNPELLLYRCEGCKVLEKLAKWLVQLHTSDDQMS